MAKPLDELRGFWLRACRKLTSLQVEAVVFVPGAAAFFRNGSLNLFLSFRAFTRRLRKIGKRFRLVSLRVAARLGLFFRDPSMASVYQQKGHTRSDEEHHHDEELRFQVLDWNTDEGRPVGPVSTPVLWYRYET